MLNLSLSVWRTLWVCSPGSFWKMSVVDADKPERLPWPGGGEGLPEGQSRESGQSNIPIPTDQQRPSLALLGTDPHEAHELKGTSPLLPGGLLCM